MLVLRAGAALISCCFLVFYAPTSIRAHRSVILWLLLGQIATAAASGVANGTSITALSHYCALYPAFVAVTVVRFLEERSRVAFRIGLATACLGAVAYYFVRAGFRTDLHSVVQSETGMHVNGAAFLAVMSALCWLDSAFWFRPASLSRGLSWVAAVGAAGFCVLTGSRTSLAALVGALAVFVVLRAKSSTPAIAAGLLAGGVALAVVLGLGAAGGVGIGAVDDYLAITSGDRAIAGGSGRFELWSEMAKAVAAKPILGYGPGQNFELAATYGITSAHSGYVLAAVETGLIGFGFIVAATVCAAAGAMRRGRQDAWACATLTAGILVAFGESVLFHSGNCGSLLFLTAAAAVSPMFGTSAGRRRGRTAVDLGPPSPDRRANVVPHWGANY